MNWDSSITRMLDDPLNLNIGVFKRVNRQISVPDSELHRLSALEDLLSLRSQFKYFEDNQFNIDEINVMIENICVN